MSIVIGRSLSCLLYCWRKQIRCIIDNPLYSHRFDKDYEGYDLSFMNSKDPRELWSNLSFAMAMSSLLLVPNNVETIREEDDGITVITKGSRIKKFKTNEIIYFDKTISDSLDVYDFFDTRSMRLHDKTEILDDDDFVRQINFYSSPRSSVAVTKDLVSSSRMTTEQLLDPAYGNGIVRLKMLRMLKSEGITGPLSVKTEKKTYYKTPKIEFFKRIVSERTQPLYSFDEVFKLEQIKGEAWNMIEKLRVR